MQIFLICEQYLSFFIFVTNLSFTSNNFLHQFPVDRPRTSETLLLETTYTWVCNLKVLSSFWRRCRGFDLKNKLIEVFFLLSELHHLVNSFPTLLICSCTYLMAGLPPTC